MTEENMPHDPSPENQEPIKFDAALQGFMDKQDQPGSKEAKVADDLRRHDARNENMGQLLRTITEELQEMQAEEAAARAAGSDLSPEARQRLSALSLELAQKQAELWGNADKAIDEQTIEHERDDR